jgi:septal ring factor EnvC (AmiA/AmiB activator)
LLKERFSYLYLKLYFILKTEKDLRNDLNQKQEFIEKQSNELSESNDKLAQLKQDLDNKSNQITSYLIEIKDLNQEKNQLSQNILELEQKKAEIITKIHNDSINSSANDSENKESYEDFSNLIKVGLLTSEYLIQVLFILSQSKGERKPRE